MKKKVSVYIRLIESSSMSFVPHYSQKEEEDKHLVDRLINGCPIPHTCHNCGEEAVAEMGTHRCTFEERLYRFSVVSEVVSLCGRRRPPKGCCS